MVSAERVVLITGVGRYLGGRIAARLSADASIGRIIGVDIVPPAPGAFRLGRTEFVRADIRSPLIGKVLEQAQVDTVVHPGVAQPRLGASAAAAPGRHLAGTVQLLAACELSHSVQRVIVASTTAVYGSSRHDPALFREDMPAPAPLPPGPGRDAAELEDHVRSFARRRPGITVSVLRLAGLIGPTVDSWLTRYLALPIVPTSLGFDPRLQLLHDSDAVEVFRRVVAGNHPAVLNVAADGVVTLAQVLRWAGRPRLPLPGVAIGAVAKLARPIGFAGADVNVSLLNFGRVVDNTRMKSRLDFVPQFSTAEAVHSYLDARPRPFELASAALAGAQRAWIRS